MLVLAQILQSIEIWIWVVASELCLSKKLSVLNGMVFCGSSIDRSLSLQEAFRFESIGYSILWWNRRIRKFEDERNYLESTQ